MILQIVYLFPPPRDRGCDTTGTPPFGVRNTLTMSTCMYVYTILALIDELHQGVPIVGVEIPPFTQVFCLHARWGVDNNGLIVV